MNFDFNDPEIRDMVQDNHVPEEVWRHAGNRINDYLQLVEVRCAKCQALWPCPTIVALRIWKKNRHEEQERELEEIYRKGLAGKGK